MSIIEQLKPASQEAIAIYLPYYSREKQNQLPYAISLCKKGSLEGRRVIEGGDSISFVAFWNPENVKLPYISNYCTMQFNSDADLTYTLSVKNSDLVGYLIDLIIEYKKSGKVDFPKEFYQKLLRFKP